jgi:GGDEF domain-containing protein
MEQVREKIERLLRSTEDGAGTPTADGHIVTSGTVGAGLYPEHGPSARLILEHADADMYARKRGGASTPQPR